MKKRTNRLGESKKNNKGKGMTIVRYNGYDDVTAKFEDGCLVDCEYSQFKNGSLQSKVSRIGEESICKDGSTIRIVEYSDASNIIIEFEDGKTKKTKYNDFKNGSVKNRNFKSIFSVGCIGDGRHFSSINEKETIEYTLWHNIMNRCYNKDRQDKDLSYEICSVSDEWHNFQIFGDFFDNNYYQINNEKIDFDKDLLEKGNKVYCAEKCIFIPRRINQMLAKNSGKRGKYPIGVCLKKNENKFRSQIKKDGVVYSLGSYNSINEAFRAYKIEKEKHIKEVAEEYKNIIPVRAYEALVNWVVDIND